MKKFTEFLKETENRKQFSEELPPAQIVTSKTPLPKEHRSGRYVRDFRGNLMGEVDAYTLPPGVAGTKQMGPPDPEQKDPLTRDPVPNTPEYEEKIRQAKK